jgi:cytosine/adenosine deaminase-related metal-dependent hydrolase
MTTLLVRAAWVCPVAAPPLADGWVHVCDGRIAAVGRGRAAPAADRFADLGDAVLLPGLVNAHTHLELSWLRGLVPPAADFLRWVGELMRRRTRLEAPDEEPAAAAMHAAIVEMLATGTAAVGDVANALISPRALQAAGVPAVVFHELLGFRVADGAAALAEARARRAGLDRGEVRVVPALHAPFSVSAELFRALGDELRSGAAPRTSIHVGESPEELQLLRDGSGPWREQLEALGVWRDDWVPPGTGPIAYLEACGVIGPRTLVAHGVQLSDAELERLAAAGTTLVTCPRSNSWVGVGAPPVARFVRAGVRLAIGTDSLASAPDLNLFGELAALRAIAAEVPARTLLDAATRGGAEALGLGDVLGSLSPGKRAHLVAVALGPGVRDPEEALVSGVARDRVRVLRADHVEAEAG